MDNPNWRAAMKGLADHGKLPIPLVQIGADIDTAPKVAPPPAPRAIRIVNVFPDGTKQAIEVGAPGVDES